MSKAKRDHPGGVKDKTENPNKKIKLTSRPSVKPQKAQFSKSQPTHSKSSKKFAHKQKTAQKFQETETDSDPIEESDTQSESGADDGVSWPSDQEEQGVGAVFEKEDEDFEDFDNAEDDEDGGVKIDGSLAKENGVVNVNGSSTTSRESHQKQKAIAQERKAAKPNAEVFARSKKIWERLRLQSHVPLPERKKLVSELFDLITDRVKDFVLKHDTSRVIQTALKYGNLEQRKMIARELKGTYCELAQSKFAKHAIGKILVHGDDEIRDIVIPEFYGNVRKLIKHPEAAWILDDVYRGAATSQQKARLLREWYGAEYAIFKLDDKEKVTSDLTKLLDTSPEKKTPILRYLLELINQLIQKKTTGFTMLHDAMLEYYINVRGTDVATEFLEIVKGDEEGDLLKNLAFTKSGARLVSLLFAYSTAKDRKQLLRAYKDVIQTMAFDEHAHKVLLSALDVIDDTRLTSKSIYGEFLPPPEGNDEAVAAAQSAILDAALHKGARTVLLYPFVYKISSILPKDTASILSEVQKIRETTSKKDPSLRKTELAKSIAPQVLAALSSQIPTLLAESFGCQLISEVLLASNLDVVDPSTREPVLEAVLASILDPVLAETLQSAHVGRLLKSLVLSGHFSPETKSIVLTNPPLGFADRFFTVIQGQEEEGVRKWATGPNSFTIVGMMESRDFTASNQKVLIDLLTKGKSELIRARDDGNKGAGILLNKLEI